MQCKECKTFKKAENCIKCKKEIESKFKKFLDDLYILASWSISTNQILNKIDEIREEMNIKGEINEEGK